jgi:hypothetical protein
LSSREKTKQIPLLEDIIRISDILINGLAFCQAMNFILKEFSSQSIFWDLDTEQKICLNFMNFTSVEAFHNVQSKNKNSNTMISKNEDILPPELYNLHLKPSKKLNPYKSGVFFCGCLILRLGVGHPLFDMNSSFKFLNDEEAFKNQMSSLCKEFENNFLKNQENQFLLSKLINNLKIMLSFSPDDRPDFLDLFRKKIDLNDMEKIKSHILVCDGLMLPLFERYDNPERKSQEQKNENPENKTFELSNSDRMVKIIGVGGIQIKQTFHDEE